MKKPILYKELGAGQGIAVSREGPYEGKLSYPLVEVPSLKASLSSRPGRELFFIIPHGGPSGKKNLQRGAGGKDALVSSGDFLYNSRQAVPAGGDRGERKEPRP